MNRSFNYIILTLMVLSIFVCCSSKTSSKEMIREYSRLELPNEFEIVRDSTAHAPTAFDSDYIRYLSLQFSQDNAKTLINEIRHSAFIDSTIWNNSTNKSFWCRDKAVFRFIQPNSLLQDRVNLKFDTTTNILDFELIHI